jgi:hypothetical protein
MTIRALGMLSGGLDSALAARLLLDQGIEVIGFHLESPTACRNDVAEVARSLGIRLVSRPKGEEYLRLLRHPRWGYGRNMNPCVDCRIFMFRHGRAWLEEFEASFLFTGEVVGQRPLSQVRDRMDLIDREAQLERRVLRPLSARLLPETEAERLGWVDRSRLLAIRGRSRHEQLRLAEHYGLKHYASPAGGCLLTDAHFSGRLRDLFAHTPEPETTLDDVALLRIGRHFRIDDHLKIVIGRDQDENHRLASFETGGRWRVEPDDFRGPSALVCGTHDQRGLEAATDLILRHTSDRGSALRVRWTDRAGLQERRIPLGAPVPTPQPTPMLTRNP